jgi:hypothetical protein
VGNFAHRPGSTPPLFPRACIESPKKRLIPQSLKTRIAATRIDGGDQQIAIDHRRRSKTVLGGKVEFGVRPNDIPFKIESREVSASEDSINTLTIRNGSRRGS